MQVLKAWTSNFLERASFKDFYWRIFFLPNPDWDRKDSAWSPFASGWIYFFLVLIYDVVMYSFSNNRKTGPKWPKHRGVYLFIMSKIQRLEFQGWLVACFICMASRYLWLLQVSQKNSKLGEGDWENDQKKKKITISRVLLFVPKETDTYLTHKNSLDRCIWHSYLYLQEKLGKSGLWWELHFNLSVIVQKTC